MPDIKQVFAVATFNFQGWHKNPRVIMTFVIAFVLCLLLTDKAVGLALQFGTTMQVMEAFVWAFGDANSVMASSLLLVLLFADMPFISGFTPYYLARTKRSIWLWGQAVYVILGAALYVFFILAASVLISMQISFPGNMWSETGAILAYSGIGADVLLPISLKTMIMSYPYQCAANVFSLMLMYTLFLASFMLALNLRRGPAWGIVGVFGLNVYGLLLNPEFFMKALKLPEAVAYKANVAVGWLSPLNHATYYMHNFGYDYLPRLWMTYLIFAALIVLCLSAARRGMRKYNFMFLGTGN